MPSVVKRVGRPARVPPWAAWDGRKRARTGLVPRYLQVVVAHRCGRQRRDRVHPEVRLLEAPVPAVHLRPGDELVVLQDLDRPVLSVEVDADRQVYPQALRERAMGLAGRAVLALIGNAITG